MTVDVTGQPEVAKAYRDLNRGQNGKGDRPRNVGKLFQMNYDRIRWGDRQRRLHQTHTNRR